MDKPTDIIPLDLAVIIKLALEYNAAVIAQASIYIGAGEPINTRRAAKDFNNMHKRYAADLKSVLGKYYE